MNTSSNYTNRLIDLEMLQSISDPSGEQRVSISIAKSTPKIVTGIQKLAQRYAKLFLTISGDIQFAPLVGTNFMQALTSGSFSNYGRFFAAFASANTDTLAMLNQNTLGLSNDEIIADAELVDFEVNVNTGRVSLKVQITSLAGTSIEYIVPTATLKG